MSNTEHTYLLNRELAQDLYGRRSYDEARRYYGRAARLAFDEADELTDQDPDANADEIIDLKRRGAMGVRGEAAALHRLGHEDAWLYANEAFGVHNSLLEQAGDDADIKLQREWVQSVTVLGSVSIASAIEYSQQGLYVMSVHEETKRVLELFDKADEKLDVIEEKRGEVDQYRGNKDSVHSIGESLFGEDHAKAARLAKSARELAPKSEAKKNTTSAFLRNPWTTTKNRARSKARHIVKARAATWVNKLTSSGGARRRELALRLAGKVV